MLERPNRYEIHRPLEYKIRGATGPVVGAGRTLNISRRGVLFHAEEDLKVGRRIELVVRLLGFGACRRMGSALGKGPDVNLIVQGVTVRCMKGNVAVAIKKYKLRAAA